jgi:hypothetical protein
MSIQLMELGSFFQILLVETNKLSFYFLHHIKDYLLHGIPFKQKSQKYELIFF